MGKAPSLSWAWDFVRQRPEVVPAIASVSSVLFGDACRDCAFSAFLPGM